MWVYVCIDCWIASWISERWLFFMVHQSYLLYLLVCDDSDTIFMRTAYYFQELISVLMSCTCFVSLDKDNFHHPPLD